MEELEINVVNLPTFFDFYSEDSENLLYYRLFKDINRAIDYYINNKINFKQN